MAHDVTATEVTKAIRNAILDGTLKAGEHIIQSEWAERLNVSRIPIREALSKLQMEGLVEIVPHKGAVVTTITLEDIEELYFIRSFLEGTVVAKALPYMDTEDKEEVQIIFQNMVNAVSENKNILYEQLHDQFHRKLREKCPWKKAIQMVENLTNASMAPDLLVQHRVSIQDEHRRIVDAVMIDDPEELQAAMEYHIHRTKNNLIQYLRSHSKNEGEKHV